MEKVKNILPICESCMWEARSVFGIYSNAETIPRDIRRKLAEEYDNQHYVNHEVKEK